MKFDRIPIVLKRYDFKSKMTLSQKYSRDVMSVNGLVDINQLYNKVLPWEIETFALFSIITRNEYSNLIFSDQKSMKVFSDIVTTIRNYEHPNLRIADKDSKIINLFMIVTGLTQFQLQENYHYKLYRYSYIFSYKNLKINMDSEFKKKFGSSYQEFMKLGIIINFIFANDIVDPRIFSYVLNKYKHIVKHLVIDRNEYISLQETITKDITQFLYGFKYFYQYPFISFRQELYLPLPHLMMQTVMSSLLFRLTESNNKLREIIGKEVLEDYIFHICRINNCFDEAIVEFDYQFKSLFKKHQYGLNETK